MTEIEDAIKAATEAATACLDADENFNNCRAESKEAIESYDLAYGDLCREEISYEEYAKIVDDCFAASGAVAKAAADASIARTAKIEADRLVSRLKYSSAVRESALEIGKSVAGS